MKLENVYAIEFIAYTDSLKNTVSDWNGSSSFDLGRIKYLDIGNEAFLVRESDLEKFRKFGQGYRRITLVGRMPVDSE